MAIVSTYKVAIPREGEFLRSMHIPAPQLVAHRKWLWSELAVNGNVYELFGLPAMTLVHKVLSAVAVAWTASVTITIGDGALGAACFFSSANIAPQTAVTTGVMVDSEVSAGTAANGKYYAAADTIDATIAGATPAAGELNLWVIYSLMQE